MFAEQTRSQILDGAMACLARWGLGKTTLDDVAAAAGCSRATIYRLFPGGKEPLFSALVEREVLGFFDAVGRRLDAASSLDELLIEGICAALEQLRVHPALVFLVENEPSRVVRGPLPAAMTHLVHVATGFVEPRLRPYLPPPAASIAADWVVRLTLSYATAPPGDGLRSTVAGTVEHLLVPGIRALAATTRPDPPTTPSGVLHQGANA